MSRRAPVRYTGESARPILATMSDPAQEPDHESGDRDPASELTGDPDSTDDRVEEQVSAADEEGQPSADVKDLQEQTEEHEASRARKFGAFGGVFTPTLLTILGVIMFLRLGWVVGNAGLAGATLIILLSFAITGATGLSMSTFVTNIRVGPGGAFSMISQSLGLEAGGAIAAPLYLSQALAVVMYIFGFREGYLWAARAWQLPGVPPLVIDLATFAVIFAVAMISTRFAFRVQYLVLAVLAGALVSVVAAALLGPMNNPVTWWGQFPGSPENGFAGTTFWAVFAVFFPASTGIMAGVNMSGELKDPRRAIPLGTMSAIGVSLVVYLGLAYWLVRSTSPGQLVDNYTVMIDEALWGPAVLGGLLAATFSSALASFVGAPRILQALGSHSIIPFSATFSRRTASGEPRNATLLTAAIVVSAIMLRELNAIAPLITMIFLLTYATINMVVLVEQHLQLISFRPLLRIPRLVPAAGLAGCLFAMFIINPVFSLVAVGLVGMIYLLLLQRRLTAPTGDVRSGLFTAMAEWAAKRVVQLHGTAQRAWKPNLLVPTEDPARLRGMFELVRQIAYPMGSVKLFGIACADQVDELEKQLIDSQQALTRKGVFVSSTVIEAGTFPDDVRLGMQALSGSFFRPNILLLELPKDKKTHQSIQKVMDEALRQRIGVAILVQNRAAGLGRQQRINLWIPDQGPDWKIEMEFIDLDLAILLAYRICDSWDAELRVLAALETPQHRPKAEKFLERLVDLARLPAVTSAHVADGGFGRYASSAPAADLNVFPLPRELDAEFMFDLLDATDSSCLFTQDGGEESALA